MTHTPTEPSKFGYNPAHPIGTCGDCGGEMIFNAPAFGANAGYVHKATGKLLCDKPTPPPEAARETADDHFFKILDDPRCSDSARIGAGLMACAQLKRELSALTSKLAELTKDKERLDWLEINCRRIKSTRSVDGEYHTVWKDSDRESLRLSIDVARQALSAGEAGKAI